MTDGLAETLIQELQKLNETMLKIANELSDIARCTDDLGRIYVKPVKDDTDE